MWRYLWSPTTLGVRAIVVDQTGAVALVRHTYLDGWHLPGGGVHRQESLVECIVREMAEEIGVVSASEPALLGVALNRTGRKSDHIGVFLTTDWSRDETSSSPEIAEVRFVAPGQLPGGTAPGTARAVAAWHEGRPVGPLW